MGIVQRFQYWTHTRKELIHTILRVLLGVILLQKGISFLSNAEELRELILQSKFQMGAAFLVSYVTFAHLFGGVFIIIGLLTRLVVLLQLPVIIGALLFIIPAQSGPTFDDLFFLTLLVLILLIYFLVTGPGEVSMDSYLKKYLL